MSVIYTYYHHAKQNYYTKLAMIKKSYNTTMMPTTLCMCRWNIFNRKNYVI